MTTLVTGGNGWVPSHIVRRLARRGEQVISFDLMEPDDLLREMLGSAIEQVIFVHGDVTDDQVLLGAALVHGVDRIIHAAAITPRPIREAAEPKRIIEVNLLGTVNVLEMTRELPRIERLIYISSGAVWGDVPDVEVLTEETPSYATGLYGISKHTSERVAQRYAALYGLDIVSIRPGNVYGPMERDTPGYRGGTEPREMLRLHFGGKPVLINSLAGPYLDWTYVEDVAEGIERVWAAPRLAHDVYSLTAGTLYSIGDLLEAFTQRLPGFRYDVVPEAEANYLVSGDPPGPAPSNQRLRAEFGWAPSTSFAEGMDQYLAWILAHGPQ